MPITTIEPTAALLVIDLQSGFTAAPSIEPVSVVAARVRELADLFRSRRQPVVLVTVNGGAPGRTDTGVAADRVFPAGFADPLPELGDHPEDHTVIKPRWGAFAESGLLTFLHEHGITQVVITGIATSVGVESTARAAYDHGFHVTIATDGVTDFDRAAHEHTLTRVFPRLAETGTIAEIRDHLSTAG